MTTPQCAELLLVAIFVQNVYLSNFIEFGLEFGFDSLSAMVPGGRYEAIRDSYKTACSNVIVFGTDLPRRIFVLNTFEAVLGRCRCRFRGSYSSRALSMSSPSRCGAGMFAAEIAGGQTLLPRDTKNFSNLAHLQFGKYAADCPRVDRWRVMSASE
ncbi:hypothetical protein KCU61_g302, partial [Aureobasidium melanogenum]